ncbi:MAG TPA: methyltransferase domain-containing protein [Alphaproteobacteria bacterium]
MKLHIGARERAEGWTSFDISPGPGVDVVGNCKDLSAFAADSIETIYASHVLEHLRWRDELPAALTEWRRVLVPGGTVMISVPDIERLCQLFVHPELTSDDRFMVMKMMFGAQEDPHDIHYVGLNFDFLGTFLWEAGFIAIRRVPDLKLFDDTSRVELRGVPISLNVIAEKPR